MKYKNIDSALHNFGHSFVSLMNYVDDVYVIDLLRHMATEAPTQQISIDFSAGTSSLPLHSPAPLVKSVDYWQAWLPKLLLSQDVNPDALGPVTLRYRRTPLGYESCVASTDDRGHRHQVFVTNTI